MNDRRVLRNDFVVAACVSACPAGVDAPRYIRLVKAGRYDEAVAVIRRKNPLSDGVCRRVFRPLRGCLRLPAVRGPASPFAP